MRLYAKTGAKCFVALANHHDNFDCWDSRCQPWSCVNVGPKKDIVAKSWHSRAAGSMKYAAGRRTWGTQGWSCVGCSRLRRESGIAYPFSALHQ